ncbi:DUF3592 domain-containing protein [Microbulbifer sp. DLAB2-AA]|uniref:DUF3592 domain-containing protein n=1 Tax=Microbulbifer sp. DLAB2-AA TaxID=3243394 RepID=UPI004039EA73
MSYTFYLIAIPAVFFAYFIFWMVYSVMNNTMDGKLKNIANKIGIMPVQEFFNGIEERYISTKGQLLSLRKINKTVLSNHDGGFFNHCYYNLEHKVIFYIDGEKYICERSVFSMINNKDEGRADRALAIVGGSKKVKVYYNPDNVKESYVTFNDIKDWSAI